MGVMVYHTIVVTGSYGDWIEKAREKAVEIFEQVSDGLMYIMPKSGLVSPILDGVTNDVRTFFVAPEGSKEGWGPSDRGDDAREEFIKYLESLRYDDGSTPLSWVEVQYGNGGEYDRWAETKILNKDR